MNTAAQKAMKTKIRRMYDIANVLQSLGIIRKENVGSTSVRAKPSFRWVYGVSPQNMHHHLPPNEREGMPPMPHQMQMAPDVHHQHPHHLHREQDMHADHHAEQDAV
jgi:transcription factor E2F7/8